MVTNPFQRRDDHFGLWDQDYWSGLYVRQLASINIKTHNKTGQNLLIKIYFFQTARGKSARDEERPVCQYYSNTAESGHLERQSTDAGETVVDEQVEQAACVRAA